MSDKTQAVANIQEALPVAVSDTGTVLNLIARAASDPNCDIDKMERLMKMHGEMEMRAREQVFNDAMGRAQQKMRPVAKDASNPQTRSKYASYAALDNAVRPIYSAEGFSLSFDEGETAKADYVRVLCYVSCGGYTRTYHTDMPADGKGAKGGDVMTKTHAAGSAFTYGQRYLLKMIFNIATGDAQDDDGNAAGHEFIDEKQVEQIQALIVEVGADIPKFLKYLKVGRVEEIQSSKFNGAIAALNAKKAKTEAAS